jgi:LPXTG-motif cell wall-anchored protein
MMVPALASDHHPDPDPSFGEEVSGNTNHEDCGAFDGGHRASNGGDYSSDAFSVTQTTSAGSITVEPAGDTNVKLVLVKAGPDHFSYSGESLSGTFQGPRADDVSNWVVCFDLDEGEEEYVANPDLQLVPMCADDGEFVWDVINDNDKKVTYRVVDGSGNTLLDGTFEVEANSRDNDAFRTTADTQTVLQTKDSDGEWSQAGGSATKQPNREPCETRPPSTPPSTPPTNGGGAGPDLFEVTLEKEWNVDGDEELFVEDDIEISFTIELNGGELEGTFEPGDTIGDLEEDDVLEITDEDVSGLDEACEWELDENTASYEVTDENDQVFEIVNDVTCTQDEDDSDVGGDEFVNVTLEKVWDIDGPAGLVDTIDTDDIDVSFTIEVDGEEMPDTYGPGDTVTTQPGVTLEVVDETVGEVHAACDVLGFEADEYEVTDEEDQTLTVTNLVECAEVRDTDREPEPEPEAEPEDEPRRVEVIVEIREDHDVTPSQETEVLGVTLEQEELPRTGAPLPVLIMLGLLSTAFGSTLIRKRK